MKFTVIHPTDPKSGVRGRLSSPLVITGFVPLHCGADVRYEGLYERRFLETLDFNPYVKAVWPQPLSFKFSDKSIGRTKYTPDFLIEYSLRGSRPALSPLLVEIKTRADLQKNRDKLRPGFQAAFQYCCTRGWRFRVVTDVFLERPYAVNAQFLSHYLRNEYDAKIADCLIRTLRHSGPVQIRRLLEINFPDFDEQMMALAVVWHLVATRRISVALLEPLNMNSVVWESNHG